MTWRATDIETTAYVDFVLQIIRLIKGQVYHVIHQNLKGSNSDLRRKGHLFCECA